MYYGFLSGMYNGNVVILKSIVPAIERNSVVTHVNHRPVQEYLKAFVSYFGLATYI